MLETRGSGGVVSNILERIYGFDDETTCRARSGPLPRRTNIWAYHGPHHLQPSVYVASRANTSRCWHAASQHGHGRGRSPVGRAYTRRDIVLRPMATAALHPTPPLKSRDVARTHTRRISPARSVKHGRRCDHCERSQSAIIHHDRRRTRIRSARCRHPECFRCL